MIPPATRRWLLPALAAAIAFPFALSAQPPASAARPVAGLFDVSRASRFALDRPAQFEYAESIGSHFAELDPETQGDLLMVRHQYLAAIDAYHRAPHDSAVVWNKMGIAYQHMYALDFARLQYEKALSLRPDYPEALNNLGTVYYGQRNYHKAEKLYRRALRYRPDSACFYSNLGTAYFADRKYAKGLAAYRQAFALDPQIFVRDSLARIAESAQPEEEARLNYALAKLYAGAGDFDAAMHCLRLAFSHGFEDRKRLMADKEFAALRGTPAFHLLLTEEHWDTN